MENTQIQYQAHYKISHLILEHASIETVPIGGGQGQRGREGGGGIYIEPEIEGRGKEGVHTEAGLREAHREGGAR